MKNVQIEQTICTFFVILVRESFLVGVRGMLFYKKVSPAMLSLKNYLLP